MEHKSATCYVIAEAGSNHNGDWDTARRLVDVAAVAGADAVKFQLFRASRLYPRGAGRSEYLGRDESIFDIVKALELPEQWLPDLHQHCADRAIDFMATAFDERSLQIIDPLVAAHKSASYELTHHPLLAQVASMGKRIFVSTGAATLTEVSEAVQVIEDAGNRDIVLLQCTASYPTRLDQANVRAMGSLASLGYPVGLSDHTREPFIAAIAAVALGAVVIEKHFTLDNDLPGPDHRFAVEPDELGQMVTMIRAAEATLGHGRKETLPVEQELRQFARRSIFTLRDVAEGEIMDETTVAVLRCGTLDFGLPPSSLDTVLGRRAVRNLPAEAAITHADITD